MSKRGTVWSLETERRRVKEGRGSGEGPDYKPWITTHDFPSKGQVCRARGQTTGRIHHMMSSLERDLFLILDYDSEVTDIREQYPLALRETLLIAAEAGIKHPEANGWPNVMTSDFYYCKNGVWYAAAVKPSSELSKARVAEKLKIEQLYWEKKQVAWSVMTEKEINRTRARNILWITGGRPFEELVPSPDQRMRLEQAFLQCYDDPGIPFTAIIREMETALQLESGTVIQMFKHLVRKGRITLDLDRVICLDDPRRSTPGGYMR